MSQKPSLMDLFKDLDAQTADTRETILRPPFPYHGGKSKSVDQILKHLPLREKYIEPFGGSGAVLLSRPVSKIEVFNDRYAGVVAFYHCIRDSEKMKKMIDWLENTLYSREDFIECRDSWEQASDDVERAAKWYYMLNYSYGAHGRNFARGLDNSSVNGKVRNKLDLFHRIHERMKRVLVENLDWYDCVKDFDSPDAVFYFDPPYVGVWDAYSWCKFDMQDQLRMLRTIFELKGFVALSGYDNDIYNSFPWDAEVTWEQALFAGQRHHKGKQTAEEKLWIKEAV